MAKNSSVSRYWIERGPGILCSPGLPSVVAEPVADSAHGEDVLRLLGVALELLAQVPDVDVDRAGVAERGVAPHALEQHVAREHTPRRARAPSAWRSRRRARRPTAARRRRRPPAAAPCQPAAGPL